MEENESKTGQMAEEDRTHSEFPEEIEEPETEKNTELRKIHSLKEEVFMKNLEIKRLKEDIEVLQQQLKNVQEISLESNKISSDEFLLLKCEISELLIEKKLLEEENQSFRTTLEKAEVKVKAETMNTERLRQEIEVLLFNKDTEINKWKCRCEKNEMEISGLKEYIRVLNKQVSQLRSLPPENGPNESIEHEYDRFQSLQGRIEEMSTDCNVIEKEQSKLLDEIEQLGKKNTNLEVVVRKVNLEKTEFERQSVELNEKLILMMERNRLLVEENKLLNLKVRDLEKFDNYDCCRKDLFVEKQDLESNLLALSQEFHLRNRQLEEAIIENKNYETTLQNTRTTLQNKITELLVMTAHCREVEKIRDNLINRLENAEKEIETIENARNALQRDLFSCHSSIDQSSEENARKYALLERKLARCVNELDRVQSLYQKCFIENNRLHAHITELSVNERQAQLLSQFESRYSCLANDKYEIETSLKNKIPIEGREKRIGVSNENAIEEKEQEWLNKYDPEVEEPSQISDEAASNDLVEGFEKSQKMNRDLQAEELRESREEIKNFSHQLLENIRLYNIFQDAEKYRIKLLAENRNICELLKILFDSLGPIILKAKNLKEFEKSSEKKLQQIEANNAYLQNEKQKMTSRLYNEVEEKYKIKNVMRTKIEENENLRTQVQNLSVQLKLISDNLNETTEKKKVEASENDISLHQEVQKFEQSSIENGIKSLINESEYLRAQIENLVQKFTVAMTELECLKAEKENLERSLIEVKASNITLSAEKDEWRNKYNEMVEGQNENNCEVQKLIKESKYLFIEAVNFSEKLKWTLSRKKYLELTKTHSEQKFSQLAVANENLRTLMRSCTQEYDVKAKEISELHYNLQELVRENETLATQNATLREKSDSKTKEVDDLKLLSENIERKLRGVIMSFDLLSCQVLHQLERLKDANKNLKTENNRLLESNREKLKFLKLVEIRVVPVAKEMEHLKLLNKELESVNNNMKEELKNRLTNEHELKLDQASDCQLENGMKISNENDDGLLGEQNTPREQELELKEENGRKLVVLEPNDVEVLKNNETRLIHEMEKLHDQNKILRLEVDKLIVHVEQFSNSENSNSTHEFERTRGTFKEDSNGRNGKLENAVTRKSSASSQMKPLKKENHDFSQSSEKLELGNEEICIYVENLDHKKVLHGKETIVSEEAIQSQLRSMSLKNEILLTENEQLRESLKFLKSYYATMVKKLDETAERFYKSDRAHIITEIEEVKLLDHQIQDGREKENLLLTRLKTLNVKLVEESERIAALRRTHTTQLQKQIEINKSLESRIHNYENRERDEGWKPLNIEQTTKLEEVSESDDEYFTKETDTKILVNGYGYLEDETNADSNDAYERFKTRKDGLREKRVTLKKIIDEIGHILSRGESDIDNLQNHFKILKDEYQKMIQFEDDPEDQFIVLLFYKNKSTNRKYHQFSAKNSTLTEKSLEKERHIESSIEHLQTHNGHGIINTGSMEKLRSLISGSHETVSSGVENEISTIYSHGRDLEAMEIYTKESRFHVEPLTERRGPVALPEIVFKENKLQDSTTINYTEITKKMKQGSSNDNNKGGGNRIFSNLRTFIQQYDVYTWWRLSACFLYFLVIYCLADFFFVGT